MKEAEIGNQWRKTIKKEIEDAYSSEWKSWMKKGGFMEQLAKKLNEGCTLKPGALIPPMGLDSEFVFNHEGSTRPELYNRPIGLVLGDDVHDFFSHGPDWAAIDAFIVMVTMHSYLQDLWIHGYITFSDTDEGWRKDRKLTWDRWVLAMVLVFSMDRDEAIKLASEFFEASDSIHSYS